MAAASGSRSERAKEAVRRVTGTGGGGSGRKQPNPYKWYGDERVHNRSNRAQQLRGLGIWDKLPGERGGAAPVIGPEPGGQSAREPDDAERVRRAAAQPAPGAPGIPGSPSVESAPVDTSVVFRLTDDKAAQVFDHIYGLLALGYGEHWRLTKAQSLELGRALVECKDEIPLPVLKSIEKLSGPVHLLAAAAVITIPKVITTVQNRQAGLSQEQADELAQARARNLAAQREGFAANFSTPPVNPESGAPIPTPPTNAFDLADAAARSGLQRTTGENGAAPTVLIREGGFYIE